MRLNLNLNIGFSKFILFILILTIILYPWL